MVVNKCDGINAIIGSVAFWLPSVLLHALRGPDVSFFHCRLLIYVQTFSTLATLIAIWFARNRRTTLKRVALWMLFGIWVLGPLWLSINATFAGGGFARKQGWLGVIAAIILFPVMTPLLAVYDGSILSVVISTLLLGLASIDFNAILTRKQSTPIS